MEEEVASHYTNTQTLLYEKQSELSFSSMIIRTRFRLQRFYEVNRNSWHIWYYCKAYKQRLKHGTFQQVRRAPIVTQKSAGEMAPMK